MALLVIIAGVLKFNFTDKDIYVEDEQGNFVPISEGEGKVDSFEDCVEEGSPVMESHPMRCIHEGVEYVEEIIIEDFDGEADPDVMTLDMTKWRWQKTIYNNDTEVIPVQKDAFTLSFKEGNVSIGTDCNQAGGGYSVDGKNIEFGDMMSTLMYCEDSQEGEFLSQLGEVKSYLFTSHGELVLEFPYDSGQMIFR